MINYDLSLKQDNSDLGNLFKFLIDNLSINKCNSNYTYNKEGFRHYANFWDYDDLDKSSFNNMMYSCMIFKKNRKVDIEYSKSESSHYIKIKLKTYSRIYFNCEEKVGDNIENCFYPSENVYNYEFIIFSDLSIFSSRKNRSIYPTSLKDISKAIYVFSFNSSNGVNDNINKCMNLIYEFFSHKHKLFKDILEENKNNLINVNIKVNDIWKCNTKLELLNLYFKNAKISKVFNKLRLQTGYMILKASKYVDEKEIQKLYILDDKIGFEYKVSMKQQIIYFLALYYKTVLNNSKDDIYYIHDYVRMAIYYSKSKKVNLKIKSIKRIYEEHDKLTKELYERETPTIKIKKNSKFRNLKLDEEFEKITTKKRLIQETRQQKHCVWSYGKDINNDNCMIYSTIFNEKRYTLEIRKKRNKYILAQIQGFRNSEAPQELINIIETQLSKQKVA